MKRISKIGLIASLLTACMLTACTVDDAEGEKGLTSDMSSLDVPYAVYEGEWTVNKQVVDTARLEVKEQFRIFNVRLPETYLLSLCFQGNIEKAALDDQNGIYDFVPGNSPEQLRVSPIQGYNDSGNYYSIGTSSNYLRIPEIKDTLSFQSVFWAKDNGSIHDFMLFAKESGSMVYRKDTELYTICIPVDCILDVDYGKDELHRYDLSEPVTLYYNATKRIQ